MPTLRILLKMITNIKNLNSTITGNSIFEDNEITINDIYLNTVAIGIKPDSGNYPSIIYEIASQCPLNGGPACFTPEVFIN